MECIGLSLRPSYLACHYIHTHTHTHTQAIIMHTRERAASLEQARPTIPELQSWVAEQPKTGEPVDPALHDIQGGPYPFQEDRGQGVDMTGLEDGLAGLQHNRPATHRPATRCSPPHRPTTVGTRVYTAMGRVERVSTSFRPWTTMSANAGKLHKLDPATLMAYRHTPSSRSSHATQAQARQRPQTAVKAVALAIKDLRPLTAAIANVQRSPRSAARRSTPAAARAG
jgi:hypothetical protein